MIYLEVNDEGFVTFQHNMPFDAKHGLRKTQEQLEQEGILVNSIPEPEQIEGKQAVLYYDETQGLYYQYEDIKLKEDLQQDMIDQLILDNLNMQMQIDTLITSNL
ncbi:hypothetical protein [Wukongibacter sp. M2B1]|uniref:hypothetical protein n=1 Tax=Wukongibacter sp. M2B1 TaxID=3088895 RepID=UPI003D7B6B45